MSKRYEGRPYHVDLMKIWKEVDTLLSSQISDEIQKTPDFKRAGVAKKFKKLN